MKDTFEPKRQFRFIADIANIQPFYIRSVQFFKDNTAKLECYESVHDPVSEKLFEWMKNKDVYDGSIYFVDDKNNHLQRWKLSNIELENFLFKKLDYSTSDPVVVEIYIKYMDFDLK